MPDNSDRTVVLMTGGGGIKGRELAARLVRAGNVVVISDLDLDRARQVADFVGHPDRIRALRLDVGDEQDWDAALADIRHKEGRLDALVNSARVISRSLVSDLSLEEWRASIRVNLDGPFLGAKHCIPLLIESGGGSIVNVISLSAVLPNDLTAPYSASNAAVRNLSRVIALQYAHANVRSNSIVVGFSANSPMEEEAYALAKELVPLGRPNTPDDIAGAIEWILSDNATYLTGTEIRLDGGRSAGMRMRST